MRDSSAGLPEFEQSYHTNLLNYIERNPFFDMDFPTEIVDSFRIDGRFLEAKRWGSGNVNDTFLATFAGLEQGKRYIFQRINHLVFNDPKGLMANMHRVTDHLATKRQGYRTLCLIDTFNDEWFACDENGNYWRAYEFVEGTKSPEFAQDLTQAYEAAKAFGAFQRDLIDLPGPPLVETIPEFHHTLKRLDRFEKAVVDNSFGRVEGVAKEVAFIQRRRGLAEWFESKELSGELIRRVVHNDTKLNNVMLDCDSGKAVCVIDLDTVMPGFVAADFGDLARSAAASALEDEKNLDKMFFRLDVFEALTKGYLETASSFLTPLELESLPLAPQALTLELAARFLTDYIEGDVYFKTERPEHNLDRARAQLKLLLSMEEQEKEVREVIDRHTTNPV